MLFAAGMAAVVDRVYTGLRRAVHPRVREVYRESELTPGLENDYYFALLRRDIPAAALRAMANHQDVDPGASAVSQGIAVRASDGSLRLTQRGRELSARIQLAVDAGARQLWAWAPRAYPPPLRQLPALVELIGRLLEEARSEAGPVFAVVSDVYEPPDADDATRLSTRLGALRHHRADAHRAAWRAAGLTLDGVRALPDGPRRRDIEDDTDRRNATLYRSLTEVERTKLLCGLGSLPN